MQLARDYREVAPALRGSVLAIGNFDGLHPGHLAIIERARALATQHHAPLAIMSFYPHPVRKFKGKDAHARLMSLHVLLRRLKALTIDLALVQRFTDAFCALSGQQFIDEVLCEALAVRGVVTGQGFAFGHQRSGSEAMLQEAAAQGRFDYVAVPPVSLADGCAYASSAVRKAIMSAQWPQVRALLGRDYGWMGQVIHGQQQGKKLGFATANLAPPPVLHPAFGVYAVRAWDMTQPAPQAMDGVANWGVKPSFGVHKPMLEVHLLDRDIDLYGHKLYVEWVAPLRAEQRFENIQALCQQIQQDCLHARQVLTQHPVGEWPF